MRKLNQILFLFISSIILFTACGKKDFVSTAEQFRLDSIAIKNYIQKNNLNMEYHQSSGIWYSINTIITEENYQYKAKDTLNKKYLSFNARIKYKGTLLNNTEFDSFQADTGLNLNIFSELSTYSFPFNSNIIPALVLAFSPKKTLGGVNLNGLLTDGLQKGNKIRLITPSYYGYGTSSTGVIPTNSPLSFEIEVLDIRDNKTPVYTGL